MARFAAEQEILCATATAAATTTATATATTSPATVTGHERGNQCC